MGPRIRSKDLVNGTARHYHSGIPTQRRGTVCRRAQRGPDATRPLKAMRSLVKRTCLLSQGARTTLRIIRSS